MGLKRRDESYSARVGCGVMEESGGDKRELWRRSSEENGRNGGYAFSNPKPKPNMHFARQRKKGKIKCHVVDMWSVGGSHFLHRCIAT